MTSPSDEADNIEESTQKAGRKKKIRRILMLLVLLGLVLISKPVAHVLINMAKDRDQRRPLKPNEVDDASRLNRTVISEVWTIPQDQAEAETQLQKLLARARKEKKRVSIAGAKHSMGGHTIFPDGIVINMLPFNGMNYDEDRKILTVGSGATWAEIIAYLDPLDRSVAIMQSNNSFSVGGSISVNCHGWQYNKPPIASTVESFRLMKADGEIVTCSRNENAELFSLALGGYGLFGIILDVELQTVPNRCYRLTQMLKPVTLALGAYEQAVQEPGVEMVYARMNIVPEDLLEEVILNVLTVEEHQPIPPLKEQGMEKLRRAIFRGSV